MKRLCLLLVFLPVLTFACISGYNTEFDGQCMTGTATTSESFANTQNYCASRDSHVTVIRSQEEQNAFHSLNTGYSGWLGLMCDGDKFVWEDGTIAAYTNFKDSQVCDSSKTDVRYYIYWSDGKWYPASGTTNYYRNCQQSIRSWICDTYYLLELGKSEDTCYLLYTALSTQSQAESSCKSQLAHVSAVHDQTFNDYLKRTATANGLTNGILLGLKFTNGQYAWSDGSSVDYTYWAPGFPDESFGECVAMGISLFPGKWINTDCATPLPYMCTKPSLSYDDVVPAGCGDSDLEFYPGDEIFSPTWGNATGPALCDYALMDLDKSKKVTVEIVFFESNLCCDTLTIYDGLVGSKVLKTLNGYYGFTSIKVTASSNSIRMDWNAKSGAHVRGWHAKLTSA